MDRERLLREAAARGKYAPLYRHLSASCGAEWRASFCEVETILGFLLPDAARLHRPWWSNRKKGGGHSHALAWQPAGWRTRSLEAETLVFERTVPAPTGESSRKRRFDVDRDWLPVPGGDLPVSPSAANGSTTSPGG